jgi:iron-sulfur cluster assembly accessory protein
MKIRYMHGILYRSNRIAFWFKFRKFADYILWKMSTTREAPVFFSSNALVEIKKIMNDSSFDRTKYLRLGVKGGGCSGLSYILGFDAKQELDEEFESEGLNFIMNPAHGIYLSGMLVDWQDGLNARGFTFSNPNASKTCGCGSSFAV